jgi:hypothetical protein
MTILCEMLEDAPLLFIGLFLVSPLGIMVIGANLARTNRRYRRMRERRDLAAWLEAERRKEKI